MAMTQQDAIEKAQKLWGAMAKAIRIGPYFEVGNGTWTIGSAKASWEAAFSDAEKREQSK